MVPGPQCHGGQNMVSHQKFVAGDETLILNTVKHVHFAETLFPENFHFFAGIKLCHSKIFMSIMIIITIIIEHIYKGHSITRFKCAVHIYT